jgi:adenosylhomocysteine nucleosidase
VIAGGGDAAFLARELAREASGAAGIISFGMAGALSPALRIGDWVIGSSVVGQGAASACAPAWIAALSACLPAARIGAIYADGSLIADAARKASLHETTGALAADMESHLAARAAAEAGMPFAVLRCISDEAAASLPPAIAVAMKPGGGLASGQIVMSIVRKPSQLTDIMHSVLGFRRAFATFAIGARAVGPRFAFDRAA